MKQAQIFSLDLMIAVLIVLVITGSLSVLLYQYQIYDEQQTQLSELEMRSEPALNVLMLTQGNPEDWSTSSCSDIKTLGLMSEPGIISDQKLKNMTTLDYDCTRNRLGIPGYNFYFEARTSSGSIYTVGGTQITTGIEPAEGSEAIFSNRKALTDSDNDIVISLGVWYE